MSNERQSRQGLSYPSTREQALDAALTIAHTFNGGVSAETVVRNAKLIEAYLDGESE